MTNDRVELQIDELVLEGLGKVDGAGVGAAVRRELTRLVTEGGVPGTWRGGVAAVRLDGGAIPVPPGASVDALGVGIARAVYRAGTPQGGAP